MIKFSIIRILGSVFLICFMPFAFSQTSQDVAISGAWVRATSLGQEVGAGYMTLTSTEDTTLLNAEASVAGSVEIHSMTMNNGVMKMRMLENLELKAGKPVDLAPGGFHLMLFDLKSPLKEGEKVEFKLHFKTAKGERVQTIIVPIKKSAEEHAH